MSHDQYVDIPSSRRRRPALIPASAFNSLDSTEDLSSILPVVAHGNGCVYLLPPAAPPAELVLQMRLEQSLRPTLQRQPSSSDMDIDGGSEWAVSGSTTPVAAQQSRLRRWSMKDVIEPDRSVSEESQFETPKQFIHKRQTSGVSEDLFSWVNSTSDAESGVRHIHLDGRIITDLDSLPTSPMSSSSKPDVQRQLQRLQEASRILHGL